MRCIENIILYYPLSLYLEEHDEDWFDDIDEKKISFKNMIHNWIKDAEHERKE